MPESRLRVLTMFEEIPRDPADVAGIFSLDYVSATAAVCEVTVLMPGRGGRPGLVKSTLGDSGVELITWTPWLRGGAELKQRLGRMEALIGLSRLSSRLPQVDLIHAHGPVFHGAAALTLGRKLDVPVVVSVHTGPFSKLMRRATVRQLSRRTLEGADCVCPVSHDLRRQIEASGFRTRRIEVTYNPVDTDLFRPATSAGRTGRIVFAGRLEEYKGALRVVRAFAEIAARQPDYTLTIAGDGPERPAIEEFLSHHPMVAQRVELIGSYTKPQFAELLATSDCFVYPSRHESFGIVLVEAMSAGLPVIGPNCTAPPEFIDSDCGVLVPPDDHTALSQAMERLLADLPTYSPEVIRGKVVERFGIAAFGQRLLSVYNEVRRSRRDAAACAASPA